MKRLHLLWIVLLAGPAAIAQQEDAATSPPAVAKGLLPVPDYTGDLASRRFLSGDWGGSRSRLAEQGIQVEVGWTQYVQGIVDGGRRTTTRYGANLDYKLDLDLMRMGVLDGALVSIQAESRYGNSINGYTGQISAANTDALFPLTSPIGDSIGITVTKVTYTQFLSEQFGVFLGKFVTLGGDANEFASGNGVGQFMNSNFVFNAVTLLSVPYSTLGGGLVWKPDPHVTVSSSIYNTADSSTTTGFGDFGDGTSWATEVQFQYRLGDLPGGQNVGFNYSWDDDFTQLGGRLVLAPGQGLIVPKEDDTWFAYWSGWQYLFTSETTDKPVNLTDGKADLRGLGVFARLGFADDSTNPVEWSGSIGLGGRGLVPGRPDDTFGAGYFYIDLGVDRLSDFFGLRGYSQGVESYYNIALTPAAALTLDLQWVEGPSRLDAALILGARLGLTF